VLHPLQLILTEPLMNLKLSITTALIALTTFTAFAKMERLGINQPAPDPIVGVGLGYLTLGGGFYAARRWRAARKNGKN
jgi:hypothetical protein